MFLTTSPFTFEFEEDALDHVLAQIPNIPAVFLIFPAEGAPYLARTTLLHRRLLRLLGPRAHPSKMLHLRSVARRIEYYPYGSRLESSLVLYQLARTHFPDTYQRILKLRQPPYVKLILSNPFPRTQITTRLSGSESLHYGPFPSRAAADAFESGFLDFFQLRRCQEDLVPSPHHPGCVYGEMNKCLRPCQEVVSIDEYATESARVATFLRSNGESLIESIRAARDGLSEMLEFEEAARTHKRLEKALATIQLRGDLATEVTTLSGVAVTPAGSYESIALWFFLDGAWRSGVILSLTVEEGRPVPLDRRLREAVAAIPPASRIALRDRQDHLSLLAAWFFSSWRDGEWVPVESRSAFPYRKLVNAVHRIAKFRTATP